MYLERSDGRNYDEKEVQEQEKIPVIILSVHVTKSLSRNTYTISSKSVHISR